MKCAFKRLKRVACGIQIMNILRFARKMVASFIDFPKLLIAIVNGPAIGIAFTTLGLCDVVYASSEVSFARFLSNAQ